MNILVTGGAGFIGSHTVLRLLEENHTVTVIDNFSNSSPESLKRVQSLTGKPLELIEGNVQDEALLNSLFSGRSFEGVIHFAGLKAVGESAIKPLEYYQTNLDSTLVLCKAMQQHNVRNLIFSSSATVYGTPEELPLKETSRSGVGVSNPYGWTKYMIEQILSDLVLADPTWHITTLRYFNPIGAHESGQIGEDPSGIPNNLLPFVAQVAVGKRDKVMIFGNDYDTPDGTGVRDYIHVMDLADGHLAALEHSSDVSFSVYNLGTGIGISVLEVITAFEQACGKPIAYEIAPRRTGDIASNYANCDKAQAELDWRATRDLQTACADAWRWQSQNPDGFN